MKLTEILGKPLLAAAIRYALTRVKRLRPYLGHGVLELASDVAEHGLRAIALGRKNYLVVRSEAGGKAAVNAATCSRPPSSTVWTQMPGLPTPSPASPTGKISQVDGLLS